jgi:diacylglycerol kinase family enzyme
MLARMPDPSAAAPHYVFVLNPGSGDQATAELRERIAAVLGGAGVAHEIVEPEPGDLIAACQRAARQAREAGGVLVAAGGDGTISTAAQAALAHGCALGVVAQGTFNFFAREHELPLDADEALELLLRAQPQPVAVGLVNGRIFLVNASLGFYPRLLEDREALKSRLGRRRWVAMLAGLMTVLQWRRQLDLEIEHDGALRRLRTPTLFIGNNRLQLERIGIEPALADVAGRDGLVGLAPRPAGPWGKWRLLLRGLVGSLGDSTEIESFALRSLTVMTRRPRELRVATDGEVVRMRTPLRFAIGPRPLLLMKARPAAEGAA